MKLHPVARPPPGAAPPAARRPNVRIEGIEVDCAWPEQRVIAELDGRVTHDTHHAFEHDSARDRRLEAAGWRVIRVTWRQLHDTPAELEADLRRLLTPKPARAGGTDRGLLLEAAPGTGSERSL